jgi:hypothetical protein
MDGGRQAPGDAQTSVVLRYGATVNATSARVTGCVAVTP